MLYQRLCITGLMLTILAMIVTANAQPQGQKMNRVSAWKSVDDAISQGLPKTAIEKLIPIIEAALAEKQYDEAIKAISLKIAYEGSIEGNKPEEKITRMRSAIDESPAEMKAVMEAILANWFWHYFQQNRWQFLQRTQTEGIPSDDFTTWSLPQILAEVDKQFDKAFAGSDLLKATPIEDFDRLIEKGNGRDPFRPTMFDVVAHNALDFYAAGEQGAAKVQDAFEISVDSPVFGTREEFLAWNPLAATPATAPDSLLLRAVQLYQDLLRFHQNDKNNSALLDSDLLRLEFANNHAVGDEKATRYKAALQRFEKSCATHSISTRALHSLAVQIRSEGDLVEAHRIAKEGVARFPDSVGANRCYNLIQEIEAPSASVTTERVWSDPWPTIDIRYRNVTKVYFRLLKYDFEAYARSDRWSAEELEVNERAAVLRQQPVKSWSVDLAKTEDFQQRLYQTGTPKDVPLGNYFLVSSSRADFADLNQQLSFSEVWVSNLALVLRAKLASGELEGFVLNSKTGEAISGAIVRGWQRDEQHRSVPIETERTDKMGRFRFPASNRNQVLLHASFEGNRLSSTNAPSVSIYDDTNEVINETRFFTDRSIYRPGQTIHYKGICISFDQEQDQYRVLAREQITVVFSDTNGKEIERQVHQTNDYGSFAGSVTAPRDRLMGEMYLQVDGEPEGEITISVEEYKRPKFRVELASPRQAAKLGERVTVKGSATAYSGVAISDAKVSWRVVREIRYPIWWSWRCWWMPPNQGESQEIAHGSSITSVDGSFDVTFVAKPDESVSEDSEPTFQFTVYADVTDTTGETRSDERKISVGYTTLAATMTAPDWTPSDKPIKIAVRTTSLDNEPQAAKGTVKVYALKQPDRVTRAEMGGGRYAPYLQTLSKPSEKEDPSNPNSWPLGEVVIDEAFETDGAGNASFDVELKTGLYRAVLKTRDAFGKEVTAILPLQVLNPTAKKLDIKLANLVAIKNRLIEPGNVFEAVWGSGYDSARAYVEIEHRGKLLQSYWTQPNQTQTLVRQEVTEAMRGGFYIHVTMVRENRAYLHSQFIEVPWSNKKLSIKWERFVSKLGPGQKESWTAVVSGPDATRAAAEMVATLYDASLDAFKMHEWLASFGVFRQDSSSLQTTFENTSKYADIAFESWQQKLRDGTLTYPRFPEELTVNLYGQLYPQMAYDGLQMRGLGAPHPMAMFADSDFVAEAMPGGMGGGAAPMERGSSPLGDAADAATRVSKPIDLSNVSARKNLNETAFFYPHLFAGADGSIRIEFTMPEALTEWKFLGFAHDPQLRSSLLSDTAITSKDLMVQPNPPRFVREGDAIEFTVKVSNRSATRQSGTVQLAMSDARTNESVDAVVGNNERERAFDLAAAESKTIAWRLSIPDGLGFLTYKAIGSTGRISDGEEGFLPVISRRILLTESLPLPIRGMQTKTFEFQKLAGSAESKTLEHQSLTVQMVSNPSWYAVMALPYLMEFPHECSEQTFNRLYANSLARHIVASDPKIEQVFAQWRATPALDSPLEKNDELKSVMLEETPWYRQAQDESQSRRNVGILFDQNRLDAEAARALSSLSEAQLDDGRWPWFPGGQGNEFITLYITTGFGRLRHLGVGLDSSPAIASLTRLDAWVMEMYQRIKEQDRDKNHLSSTVALYLYGRSFFLDDQPIGPEHQVAVDFWLRQAKQHWLKLSCRQSEAHLAIALKRFGDLETAKGIMASIKERSVTNEEFGMFWRDLEDSWWWYRAPIESQAMMIEAFDEVMNDGESVENCKIWLLKQKQTQDWKTTKATADAIYSLLLRGTDVLASDKLVDVTLGGVAVVPQDIEAGTGFFEKRFLRAEVSPKQSEVTVKKIDDGVAWGSVHWQYFEDISKVTPHEGTPLKLTKELYVKRNSPKGPVLERVVEPVAVGDELVVRLVLRTDRDMEYVHLKDHRASGTEPVNVISQYKYQDGLGYYESTRDTASHFFIDYLAKGTYVFEYSTRVQLRGEYQTGLANIQCMYAPEFNSHSESLPIVVK